MKPRLVAAVAAAVIAIGLIGWFAYQTWFAGPGPQTSVPTAGTTALDQAQGLTNIDTVDVTPTTDLVQGITPMAKRVAVLGLLNKRNGVARDITLKPGEATRVGDVVVRLRACEQTAPWEQDHYTGAFVQLEVEQIDRQWRRVFSGWLFKERPSLNVVQHPIYDVWTKSCEMSFPSRGADTVSAGDAATTRSSAKKSPAATAAAPAPDAAGAAPPSAPSTAPSTAAANNPK